MSMFIFTSLKCKENVLVAYSDMLLWTHS